MEIEYKGANCIVISNKQSTIVVDGKLSNVGLKDVLPKGALVVETQSEFAPSVEAGAVTVDQPGEYEVGKLSIRGVAAKRMIDAEGQRATMYRIDTGDVVFAVVGHVTSPLSEEQLEALGVVDIVVVPVGGSGYTLDAHQAVAVVRQLDPKVVIPTHYADKGVKYEVEQMELEPFLKELGAAHEEMPKFKIKNGILPETLTVIELERTS